MNFCQLFTLAASLGLVATTATSLVAHAQAKSESIAVEASSLKPPIIPVETFMRRAEFGAMSISPNGERLAALVPIKDRDNLVRFGTGRGEAAVTSGRCTDGDE